MKAFMWSEINCILFAELLKPFIDFIGIIFIDVNVLQFLKDSG